MPTTSPSGARVPVGADPNDIPGDFSKLAASGMRFFTASSATARDTTTSAYASAGYAASATNPLWCWRSDLLRVERNSGTGWVEHYPEEKVWEGTNALTLTTGYTLAAAKLVKHGRAVNFHLAVTPPSSIASGLQSTVIATLKPSETFPINGSASLAIGTQVGNYAQGQGLISSAGAITVRYLTAATTAGATLHMSTAWAV